MKFRCWERGFWKARQLEKGWFSCREAGVWGGVEGGLCFAMNRGQWGGGAVQEGRLLAARTSPDGSLTVFSGAGLQWPPFLWGPMQEELPRLSPEELGPPGWPEKSPLAQICQLSQGPCRSEHKGG